MANNLDKLVGPEQSPTRWPWKILTFSLVVFFVAVVFYFGLSFGYKSFLQSQITQTDKEFETLAQSIPEIEQKALIDFYAQLGNLQKILNNHTLGSKLFSFIEQNTNKKVYYTNLSLNTFNNDLSLTGRTDSYETLAQQLQAFELAQGVTKININQADAKAGEVNFRVTLKFAKNTFK